MGENTRMTREWVERVWGDNPPVKLANGNVRFLARLAFCNVLERPKPGSDGKEKAYGSVLLLPQEGGPVSFELFGQEVAALYKDNMPAALTSEAVRAKLHKPLKDQGTFVNLKDENGAPYEGFVEGRKCISANSSQSQPYVVDQNGAPIVDKSRIYSGCWALAVVAPGWIKRADNPGPTFYLQGLIVVADDNSLGGVGASNPTADMAGVKIDATVNPSAAFGGAAAVDLLS